MWEIYTEYEWENKDDFLIPRSCCQLLSIPQNPYSCHRRVFEIQTIYYPHEMWGNCRFFFSSIIWYLTLVKYPTGNMNRRSGTALRYILANWNVLKHRKRPRRKKNQEFRTLQQILNRYHEVSDVFSNMNTEVRNQKNDKMINGLPDKIIVSTRMVVKLAAITKSIKESTIELKTSVFSLISLNNFWTQCDWRKTIGCFKKDI